MSGVISQVEHGQYAATDSLLVLVLANGMLHTLVWVYVLDGETWR